LAAFSSAVLTALFTPMALGLALRGLLGFYRGIVASGDDNARGSVLIVFCIFMTTTIGTSIAAHFIGVGLPALALVATAIHALSVLTLLLFPKMS
jgi:DHA1 family bicyclomycin/chloramphenicol resistance-like MFS transporter